MSNLCLYYLCIKTSSKSVVNFIVHFLSPQKDFFIWNTEWALFSFVFGLCLPKTAIIFSCAVFSVKLLLTFSPLTGIRD